MDADPSGRFECEVSGWSGIAYRIPRSRVKDCAKEVDFKGSAVYFLFGSAEISTSKPQAYIGQTEDIYKRLSQHKSKKDFWNEAVVFMRKDQNLNKAYVESRIHSIASKIDRYELINENTPSQPIISKSEHSDMEEYIEYIEVLINILGHKLLKPLTSNHSESIKDFIHRIREERKTLTVSEPVNTYNLDNLWNEYMNYKHSLKPYMIKAARGANALGIPCDDGFLVRKGSFATLDTTKSCPKSTSTLRDELVATGMMKKHDNSFMFNHDYLFSSPSSAAKTIMGRSTNGLSEWKDNNGYSLGSIENSSLSQGITGKPITTLKNMYKRDIKGLPKADYND